MSEARIMRERQEGLAAATRRLVTATSHDSEAVLVKTKATGAYPSIAAAFYSCSPLWIDGSETEGSAATFTEDPSRTITAFNLGSKIPPAGTKLIIHSSGGRWAFRFDG